MDHLSIRQAAGNSEGDRDAVARLAIIGDIHYAFSESDVAYFNESDYQLLLFVGDLSTFSPRRAYPIARRIARLQKPALFIPGNHDTVSLWQLLAEMHRWTFTARLFGLGQARRAHALRRWLGNVQFTGYTRHAIVVSRRAFDLITARPYSMGGPHLNFVSHLSRQYRVSTMAESIQQLQRLVDGSQSENLIFLAHNGPAGLGSARTDIWGCDFRDDEGDYGDPDLSAAIAYARATGRRVLAAIAGHMHHQLKGGGIRRWCLRRDDTLYVNAARVPRIFSRKGKHWRHHVSLVVDADHVEVEERLVEHRRTNE